MEEIPTPEGIVALIKKTFEGTPYACTRLIPLSGGTGNFMYRGNLASRWGDGTTQVAIKHSEPFVASFPAFKLTINRSSTEAAVLARVAYMPLGYVSTCRVLTPTLYHFDERTHTQVQKYLPKAVSLKDYALRHCSSPDGGPTADQCIRIGRDLGAWLKRFHEWADEGLREQVKDTEDIAMLKYTINYERLVETIPNFLDILEDARETFEAVRRMAREERDDHGSRPIHGDFWTGNVLLQDEPIVDGREVKVFIVDWELSHLGRLPIDLGQFIAELYELKLFKGIDAGLSMIDGFVAGYGIEDDEFAYRTAIHVGTHLVAWGSRVDGWGSSEQVKHVVKTGKDIIVRAWEQDKTWFDSSDLKCLFQQRPES